MSSYFASPSMRFLRERFTALYGAEVATGCLERVAMMVGRYGVGGVAPAGREKWDEHDAILITYADMIKDPGRAPLRVLGDFADQYCREAFSTLHVLPFFPSSSDDGFSVVHYRQVSPDLGTWEDVRALGRNFQLMFDLVLNHASSRSNWFTDYRTGVAPGRHYFIEVAPDVDTSSVVRPRTCPLLTPVYTRGGEKTVWTTFSADQVDLDYRNPDVLFEMLDLLLFYVSQGARMIRLDAVAYLWKSIGTSCIHQPETYEIIRIFREFLRLAAPDTVLVAEANVPHEENMTYLGNGDVAHMIYQFPLPALVLDAMVHGDARWLSEWASVLKPAPPGCSYLNFTASHDGIGLRPLQGVVPPGHVDSLVAHVHQRGGGVSMKRDSDGSESPYELNCTWFDAMGRAGDVGHLHESRFLCSQTIPLVLQGIPGVYFHSLTATPNAVDEVRLTQRARSINRGRWGRADLERQLADPASMTARMFSELTRRLKIRRAHAGFHPNSAQRVLTVDDGVFCVLRGGAAAGYPFVMTIANVTASPVHIGAGMFSGIEACPMVDVLTDGLRWDGHGDLDLAPYQCSWFVSEG